jgi:hypothetical protein
MVIASPPMTVRVIANLGAILVVIRDKKRDRTLVLVDPDEPRRLVLSIARPLLWQHERRELARALRQR